jgi:hypothetical protein
MPFLRGGSVKALTARRRTGVLPWLVTAAVMPATGLAQSREPAVLAGEAVRRLGLQTELPGAAAPSWLNFDLPEWLVEALAWAVGIGCVALVLGYVFIHLYGIRWRRREAWSESSAESALGVDPAAAPIMRADELAAQGLFVEAMHRLLLEALAVLREGAGERYADSLTSREILGRARLPAAARAALREIITRVEWTYFGGRPAVLGDYEACRAGYRDFAHSLQRA